MNAHSPPPEPAQTRRVAERVPGKGITYAAARLVLGREPGEWVVQQRESTPRPSYNLLATDLSAMLANAGQRPRRKFAAVFGSSTPWPERVTFETMRAWELIGLDERGRGRENVPDSHPGRHSDEPATPAMVEIPPHDIPPAIFHPPADA